MKRLDDNERPVICAFKCLPHEKDLLVAAATHQGLTLSAFLRTLLHHLPTPDNQPLIVKPLEQYDPLTSLPTQLIQATVKRSTPQKKQPLCPRCSRFGRPIPACTTCNS